MAAVGQRRALGAQGAPVAHQSPPSTPRPWRWRSQLQAASLASVSPARPACGWRYPRPGACRPSPARCARASGMPPSPRRASSVPATQPPSPARIPDPPATRVSPRTGHWTCRLTRRLCTSLPDHLALPPPLPAGDRCGDPPVRGMSHLRAHTGDRAWCSAASRGHCTPGSEHQQKQPPHLPPAPVKVAATPGGHAAWRRPRPWGPSSRPAPMGPRPAGGGRRSSGKPPWAAACHWSLLVRIACRHPSPPEEG